MQNSEASFGSWIRKRRKALDRWGIGNALHYLSLLAFARGDVERAESLIRESVTLFVEDGDQVLQAATLTDLGYILHECNAEADSREAFQQGLEIAMRIRAIPAALSALVGIATLHARSGAIEQGFELAMYGWEHPSSDQQTRERAKKLRLELESRLTPEQIENAQVRAQSITLDS